MYRDFQWLAVCPVALAIGLVIKHDKNVCSTKPIGFTYMLHHTWTTLVLHMVRGSSRWLYGKYCNKILWIILEDLYLTHSNNKTYPCHYKVEYYSSSKSWSFQKQ